jgi:hypothetical protein
MTSESAATAGSDPLKAVADALDAAVDAARQGAEGVRATASDALPEAGMRLSRLAYKACYSVSYGVVFPTALIAHSIPKDNALVNGLVDGARAAIGMVDGMRASKSSGSREAPLTGQGGESAQQPSVA